MNTLHGFPDTVRFRGRGLIVDRAMSTGHNRVIRGGARMQTENLNVSRRLFLMTCCAREARSEAKGPMSPCKTCVRESHATLFTDKNMSWQFGGQEAVGVVSPTVRARPRRESCLFGDDVVDTTHLVVAPIVGFCEHLRARCGVFSVQGCYCSEDVFEGQFCGNDAQVRHGRDGFLS